MKLAPKIKWPAPGCIEAIKEGCSCPVEDNHYGAGVSVGLSAHYWCHTECPIHGGQARAKLKEVSNDK